MTKYQMQIQIDYKQTLKEPYGTISCTNLLFSAYSLLNISANACHQNNMHPVYASTAVFNKIISLYYANMLII